MHTLLILTLYVLVAARLTRLVNYDSVLDWLRLRIARRISMGQTTLPPPRTLPLWLKWQEFLSCPWCVGFWISVALAPLAIWQLGWEWWTWAVLPWAASHLVGIGDRWVSDSLEIVEAE